MYDLAVAQNQPNFQAIGLTLKVYNMSILTDMFGSIAYREALKGGEGINTPHIDSQQEVYTAMLEELELANSLYNASLGLDDPHQGRHLRRRHRQVAEIHQHAAPASADARERP